MYHVEQKREIYGNKPLHGLVTPKNRVSFAFELRIIPTPDKKLLPSSQGL